MQISYNWLKQIIDLKQTPDEVSKLLTSIGLEVEVVEEFETIKGGLKGFVIGKVLTCEKHPNADKLSKTTVDIGNGVIAPIVCGAPNVSAGQKVVVATVGSTCYPSEGEPFTIQKAKIRGEVSEGMICAEDEIGLGKSHAGIMVLDTELAHGTPAAQYFNMENDYIFVIGLTPNRADAASHLGVARDLFAVVSEQLNQGINLKKPDISAFKVDNQKAPVKIEVQDPAACPRYAGLTISNITIKASPDWLQNRLRSIGLGPINNVVDATNFILHDLGQPLHAFDLTKVKGNKIIVKNATAGSTFTTLDGKERKLNATDLMICNESEPMCIAGVFGGLSSGVSESTTSIFLESAYFSPNSIRKTGQLHGLKTDASFRYERGADPNIIVYALKRAALLIKEVAGGEISSEITDLYPEPVSDFKFKVGYKNIERLIGNKLPKDKIFGILDALEIGITEETVEGFTVTVPPYRVDVQREADIIEELVRIYGFENIKMDDHLGASYLADFPVITKEKITNTIADLLVGKGFNEIMTNSLTKPEYGQALGLEGSVEILNKLSPELGVMRQSLVFSGLEAISYNINRRQKDLKFFEFGKAYAKVAVNGKAEDYKETSNLSIFITGNQQSETWGIKSKPVDFYDIASVAQQVLFALNINGFTSGPVSADSGIWGQGIGFEKNTKNLVRFGQVKAKHSKMLDIKQPVYYAAFNMDYILKLVNNKLEYKEIPKFPEVRRDLSLVLDQKISFEEIQKLALRTEKMILRELNVFDVYKGDKIDQGKKAYAISIILQDEEQTLNDKQIETTIQRLMQAFEKELGAVIRM
jgi:phenylalanyl-tRNA synthetase beta chain